MRYLSIWLLVLVVTRARAEDTRRAQTEDAVRAFRAFVLQSTNVVVTAFSLTYEGNCGDEKSFAPTYDVKLNLAFKEDRITGVLEYVRDRRTKSVAGEEDAFGHIWLRQVFDGGQVNYVFKGLRSEGLLTGLWSKGEEKKQFVMHLTQRTTEGQGDNPKNNGSSAESVGGQ